MHITLFGDISGLTKQDCQTTWEGLKEWLANPPEYPSKDKCPLFKMGKFGDVRTKSGSYRSNDNMLECHGIELDYDGGIISPYEARDKLSVLKIQGLVYTSPSYTKERPRWRMICPFDRPHSVDERANYAGMINYLFDGVMSVESFTTSQCYYYGKVIGSEYGCYTSEGTTIDDARWSFLPKTIPSAKVEKPKSQVAEYAPNDNEQAAINHVLATLRKAVPGERHHARLAAGRLAGGYVAGGITTEDRILPLLCEASDEISDSGTTAASEMATLFDSFGMGMEEPIGQVGFDVASVRWDGQSLVGHTTGGGSRFELLSDADLEALPEISWRVKNVLPKSGLAVVYGAPGSGKSFLVLDMIQAIASGKEWFGHKTVETEVLYCGLEGGAGLRNRVAAYKRKHTASDNVKYMTSQFNLLSPVDTHDLADIIKKKMKNPGVIVIDTLNRASPGTDENDSRSMGLVIAGAERLQRETGSVVVLVHHSGKDSSKGMRGHSSLAAACDVAIEVKRNHESREWVVTKSKDGEDGDAQPFSLDTVELGVDCDMDLITSCTVNSYSDGHHAPKPSYSKNEQDILDTFDVIAQDPPPLYAGYFKGKSTTTSTWMGFILPNAKPGTRRQAFARATRLFLEQGVLIKHGDHWGRPRVGNPDKASDQISDSISLAIRQGINDAGLIVDRITSSEKFDKKRVRDVLTERTGYDKDAGQLWHYTLENNIKLYRLNDDF